MGKKYYCFAFLIFLAYNLAAQGSSLPEGVFVGLGPEINGHSRESLAVGANLMLGIELTPEMSLGQKTTFFTDFNHLRVVELLVFFRYKLPWLQWPNSNDGPFAQAEAGAAILMEYGYHQYGEVFPGFSGGVSGGWQFNLPSNWYIEPTIRLGYPHVWGIGVIGGIKLKGSRGQGSGVRGQRTDNSEQGTESEGNVPWRVVSFGNGQGGEDHLLVVPDEQGRMRLQVPSIVFRVNNADFSGLSAALLDSNANTLRRIAQMLNNHTEYQVLIEGHANPTKPQGAARDAEEPFLKGLSENRAQRVADELVRLGVDRNRLTVVGLGCSEIIVPYNDYKNIWKNRRVEFILARDKNE